MARILLTGDLMGGSTGYSCDVPYCTDERSTAELRQVMYQHDGCPAHNAIVAINALNQQFPNRWIGRGSPVQRFPARSPDLTHLDFCLWGM